MCKSVIKFYCKICKVFDKCEKTVFIYINVGFLHFCCLKTSLHVKRKLKKNVGKVFLKNRFWTFIFVHF